MENKYLPEQIIEDCLQKIPKKVRRGDRELLKNSKIPKERQTELLKQWFYKEITEQRRKDLEHFRHLLNEVIPRDLILEQASKLVDSWCADSYDWHDTYDSKDETLSKFDEDHMNDAIKILDTLAIVEKFERIKPKNSEDVS